MPTSATGTWTINTSRASRPRGFSLLELMIVLAIIGILLTFAMLSLKLGDQQAKVEEEVRRLQALVELAQDTAILKSEEMALHFEPDAYEFRRWEAGEWQPLDKDRIFHRHQLPDGMQMNLHLRDGSTSLGAEGAALAYVLSSGEVTPFELTIEAVDGSRYALVIGPLGKARLYNPTTGE